MSALPSMSGNDHPAGAEAYDVVVVGAGFAGTRQQVAFIFIEQIGDDRRAFADN